MVRVRVRVSEACRAVKGGNLDLRYRPPHLSDSSLIC